MTDLMWQSYKLNINVADDFFFFLESIVLEERLQIRRFAEDVEPRLGRGSQLCAG